MDERRWKTGENFPCKNKRITIIKMKYPKVKKKCKFKKTCYNCKYCSNVQTLIARMLQTAKKSNSVQHVRGYNK